MKKRNPIGKTTRKWLKNAKVSEIDISKVPVKKLKNVCFSIYDNVEDLVNDPVFQEKYTQWKNNKISV